MKMRFGIDLRSDLKKLTDAALASEFDRFLTYREKRFGSTPSVGSLMGILKYGVEWPFGRGPFHSRIAYRIQIGYFWIFRGPRGTLYLVECEIKDVLDEIARRAKARRAPEVTA